MSTRTIIEINHDFIARMTAEDWEAIKRLCLHYPDPQGRYEPVNGVRILGQRHHSETLKIEVK
jgi:hypothetical protein